VLRRLPIRWRLAGGSAVLTLVILLTFAIAVGVLTTRGIRDDFQLHVSQGADEVRERVQRAVHFNLTTGQWELSRIVPTLRAFAAADNAVIRLVQIDGSTVVFATDKAPRFGYLATGEATVSQGYRVETRFVPLPGDYNVIAQYGRPQSEVQSTLDRVRFLLIVGVLGGAALALIAGLVVARNAMGPIARMTSTTREIARTRDPERRVPVPAADDEVAELAETLNEMLAGLESSREETEVMLSRQRQFVADASHELRTPLTSVLANLELLVEELRMRRLVADLLLLARADLGPGETRNVPRAPTDLADVAVEAAAELEPVAGDHELVVDTSPALVQGARDDLHRMALNLMENALRHTPPGTRVHASVADGEGIARLIVEDDGPGIPPELRERIFERFVRGEGDGGGSFGLGLSIVRAVAGAHGGSVRLETPPGGGTRFVVELPAARSAQPAAA
jgi:two-component system, OmpR family, sensor kinase